MNVPIVSALDRQALSGLYAGGWDPPADVTARVAQIIADVRARGDAALVDYTRRFDDPAYDISKLRVPIPMFEQARALVPHEIVEGLALARERVEGFHRRQIRGEVEYADEDGTQYALRCRALDSIGAYVPGGTAALPSSVIMSVVPAKVAGVSRIIVLTPPQRDGKIAPAVLFACWLCDVDELYAVGGAQAIAAAAYGTESISRVDKIVGPGNLWVTEAKRQVYGACAIDGLAGPSEVLVIADETADPEFVVGELLAQAEHDPLARAAVVSQSRDLLEACAKRIADLDVQSLPRGEIIAFVLERNTYLIHAVKHKHIFKVVDRFCPEHLSLQVADPQAYLPLIRHAGAVFVGAQTPVACGDYIAGTNHVLPTSGAARFSSGLRTDDFTRTFSIVQNSSQRMAADARTLAALADFEGLAQHANTARMRLALRAAQDDEGAARDDEGARGEEQREV
ncbi:MAG TPA: histidinol dehydrogenase [Candidatus Baltobacteraceae bacterium]|nr:histidinol dehydrogenase [Candidatus Baltobacteraceae bacterium]